MVYEVTASVLCFLCLFSCSCLLRFSLWEPGNVPSWSKADSCWTAVGCFPNTGRAQESCLEKYTIYNTSQEHQQPFLTVWTVWFSTFIILILSLVLKICMRTHQSEARASRRENTLGKCFPDRWMSWHKPGMDSHIQKCSYFLVRQRHLWGWRSQNTSHYSQWTVKRFSSVTWYLYILNLQILI